MPSDVVPIEFSFKPRNSAAFDALYLVDPRRRTKIAVLIGVSVAAAFAGIALAVVGTGAAIWVSCLVLAALAIGSLAWWALAQCRGSPFAAGPGSVLADDHGLEVRPAYSAPATLRWSDLRGWARTERFIVLLPNDPRGRPLHIIPLDSFDNDTVTAAFKDLLRWHLGRPK